MKDEKIVVTAALPYANGSIHIGHLLEYIQADIYSRFLKLNGKDAIYICAADMHGTPIEISAKNAGISPEKFVEKYWEEHQKDFADFFIKFDNYYKTHSPENQELTVFFFTELKKKGYIYQKKIPVIYCKHCQRSLPDRLVKGTCPHCKSPDQYGDICENCGSALKGLDLISPHCTICGKIPVQKESEHYFFKLSSFAPQLEKWIKTAGIQSQIKHWLNGWLKKGLDDWCISRDAPYFGFEIPDAIRETGEKKYFYVWLDAPIGYISSTKNYCDKKKQEWKDYWYKGKVHHIIGKDIIYFHFLFWPAMLMGVGIPLPDLTVHGFITVNGQKMSKSRGTFFTAKEFLKLFPAEALRFYYASHLQRKVVDVDLQFTDFQAVNNNVLVGNLGNFCYRLLTFAEQNYGQIEEVAKEKKLEKEIENLIKKSAENYKELDFKSAVKNILNIASSGNAYFQKAAPWSNPESKESKAAVGLGVNIAKNLAILVSPILPEFSEKVFSSLALKKTGWKDFGFRWTGKLKKVEKLVQKIERIPENSESHGAHEKKEAEVFPLKMTVGEIKEVKNHPNADSLYLLKVDFGDVLGEKQVVAGLKKYLQPEEMRDRKTIFCTNMKPAKLRGEISEAMILVADDGKKVALLDARKAKLGEQAQFGSMISSVQEIRFEDFLKLKIVVKEGRVVYAGNVLNVNSQEISVSGVKEGARVR